MFTITIQKPTAEEAIAELLHAAEFYKARPELSGQAAVPPAPAPSVESPAAPPAAERKPRAKKVVEGNTPTSSPVESAPAASETAGSPQETASAGEAVPAGDSQAVAQSEPATKPLSDAQKLEAIRAELGNWITAGQQPAVTKLLAGYGGKVSACPADKLDELLAAAKKGPAA